VRPRPPGLVETFAERGIAWHPRREVCALDPARGVAILRDGEEMPYDLFLAVPVHRAPAVVVESGLTENGWIPVNPLTLETSYPGVYAIGDVAAVGTPRAGVFAEGSCRRSREADQSPDAWDDKLGRVRRAGDLLSGVRRRRGGTGRRQLLRGSTNRSARGPSRELAALKAEFGASRAPPCGPPASSR
jgi:sulfide:quinone oxidoreductase